MHAYMCVCCTYIRAHGRLVSVLMTYLNAALTLMMLLLIHIDQVHNTLYWWFVINRTCFLHFSFLYLHLCVFFSYFYVMVFAKQEGQITNPDAQIGAHYHSQPPLKQPGENMKIPSRIISALLCFLMEPLAILLIYDRIWKALIYDRIWKAEPVVNFSRAGLF